MKKAATIFEHLAHITNRKKDWNSLSDQDQKSFVPYLINRWLSMNPDLIEVVNMFQQYTIGPLDKKHVYQLYHDILPANKFYMKYTKSKKVAKYNAELVEFISRTHMISKHEATDHIDLLMSSVRGKEFLNRFIAQYGKSDKEIKKMLSK